MRSLLNKNLSLLLLPAYLYLALFSLFTMSDHQHVPMVDCPYIAGQHSLCVMDAFEHLNAWKALFLTIPNTIYISVILALVFVFFFFQILFSPSPPLIRQFLYYKKIKFEPIISKLEQQFSKGILNPKPY